MRFLREDDEEQAMQDIRSKALRWIKRSAVGEKPKASLQRLSAFSFLCSLDNALRVSTSSGLASFRTQPLPAPRKKRKRQARGASSSSLVPAVPDACVDTQHMLVLSIGQGPDGWSAANWML